MLKIFEKEDLHVKKVKTDGTLHQEKIRIA